MKESKKGLKKRFRMFSVVTSWIVFSVFLISTSIFAAGPVKIGVVLPLTGGQAPFGQASLNGIQLATDLINKVGGIKGLGGAKIEIISADCMTDPTTAASVTQRLISKDQVVAVLGAFASSMSLAASEVTERNRIPFLTMSFTDILTSRGFKYLFQVVPKASVIGAAQLSYTLEIGKEMGKPIRRIAIIYEDTAYGSSQADGLEKEAKRIGIEVALKDAYPQGVTDALPIVQKVRNSKAEAVFPVSYFTDAVLIIRSMRQSGLNIPVIGGAAGYVIPEFLKALGQFAEGILSINTSCYDHYGEIGKLYREKHGQFMTHEAFEHAILVYALVEAINKTGSSQPETIAKGLREIKMVGGPVAGLPGKTIAFDEKGLNTFTYPIMVQWQKGEMVTIWPKSDAKAKPIWPK